MFLFYGIIWLVSPIAQEDCERSSALIQPWLNNVNCMCSLTRLKERKQLNLKYMYQYMFYEEVIIVIVSRH